MKDFPAGTIMLISGSSAPSGWAICNGSNGTPNLLNKFVYGAKSDAELKTSGGSDTHVHTEPDTGTNPSHNHGGSASATISASTLTAEATTSTTSYKQCSPNGHGHGDAAITIQSVDGHVHPVPNTNSASNVPLHIQRIYIMKL